MLNILKSSSYRQTKVTEQLFNLMNVRDYYSRFSHLFNIKKEKLLTEYKAKHLRRIDKRRDADDVSLECGMLTD